MRALPLVALSLLASRALAAGVAPDGAVETWAVVGPIAAPGVPFEELINVVAGPEAGDESLEWIEATASPNLDLGALLGGPMSCVAYARAEVFAPAAQPVLLQIGSDDGVRVWINGEHVFANNAARAANCGDDAATATLEEGWNDVLLKVTQGMGGFGSCLRIVDRDGNAIQGLEARVPRAFPAVAPGPAIEPPPPVWASERWTGDPHFGDWEGWLLVGEEGASQERLRVAAQVMNHGDGLFRMRLLKEFDTRTPPIDILAGTWTEEAGGALQLIGGEWRATSFGGVLQGHSVGMTPKTFRLSRVVRTSPTLGAAPPAGAIVLFDGDDFDAWQPQGGGAVTWTLVDGAMQVAPRTTGIETRQVFTDMDVHLEFRAPYSPGNPHQFYGNSGVFLPGGHEVQVLMSHSSEGLVNECGGIYFVAPPRVNMCRPPLEWQTYDIAFRAERPSAPARITVRHNGVVVHDGLELPMNGQREGRFALQDHHNQVQYRNIWVTIPEG